VLLLTEFCACVCLSHSWTTPNGSRYQNTFCTHDTAMYLVFFVAKFSGSEFTGSAQIGVLKRGTPVESANLTNNLQLLRNSER